MCRKLLFCLTLILISTHKLIARHHHSHYNQDYFEDDGDFTPYSSEYGEFPVNRTRTTESAVRRQKINERSIAVNSGVQSVQEKESRRSNSGLENLAPRVENGSFKIVNNPPKVYPGLAARKGQTQSRVQISDSIVFPNSKFKNALQNYTPSSIPEECRNNGFCEDLPDYPEEHVEQLIRKLDASRFKIDEIASTPWIAQRIGSAVEMELCNAQRKIVKPMAAPDKDGDWYFIVNRKDKPLQGIQVEVCKDNEMPCSELAHFYQGYAAVCKQKYVLRRMTAIDDRGEAVERPFKIPSCCSCIVTHTDL